MSEKHNSETFLNNIENISCVICYNPIVNNKLCVTNCEHKYCIDCLNEWFGMGNISCPFCRQDIDFFLKDNEKNNIVKVTVNTPNTLNTLNNRNNRNNRINIPNQNNSILSNKKVIYLKLCIFMNISYIMYLQYKHYYLYNTYIRLYNNCSHI